MNVCFLFCYGFIVTGSKNGLEIRFRCLGSGLGRQGELWVLVEYEQQPVHDVEEDEHPWECLQEKFVDPKTIQY